MPTRSGRQYLLDAGVEPIFAPPSFDHDALLSEAVDQELQYGEDASLGAVASSRTNVFNASSKRCYDAIEIKRDEKKQSRNNARRALKRVKLIAQNGHVPSQGTIAKCVGSSEQVSTKLNTKTLPVANGGYNAKNVKIPNAKKVETVESLEEQGFTLIKWDGRTAKPVLDKNRRITLVCAGRPNDKDYKDSVDEACKIILQEAKQAKFSRDDTNHKRGNFPAINAGITYGNGPIEPVKLNNGKHTEMINRLLANKHIKRLAHYQSAAYALWNPKVYNYTKLHMDELHDTMPHLPRNFNKSVYSNAAFNMGPRVATIKHKDGLNLPFGWCAVHALGNFDSTKGGHLILWELKLVIEFPAGSLILLPSSTITHSNIPVSNDEIRTSFTQYSTGALFRYVDNFFMRESDLQVNNPKKYAEICQMKSLRWEKGLAMYSTIEELLGKNPTESLEDIARNK